MPVCSDNFSELLHRAFLASDIPLKKVRNKQMAKLFTHMGFKLPSESSLRSSVDILFNTEKANIINILSGKYIYAIIDETVQFSRRFTHIIVALIDNPQKNFLLKFIENTNHVNSEFVVTLIKETLLEYAVKDKNFILLISDSASYMVKAGKMLKLKYKDLFHITCFAHLLHNCAAKVQLSYNAVNDLISSMRMCLLRSAERLSKFETIEIPPDVVLTRWGSWLSAALYYAKNFVEIKCIISRFHDDGILVERVRNAINNEKLRSELFEISMKFSSLYEMIKKVEECNYTIDMAIRDAEEICTGCMLWEFTDYFRTRMDDNDFYFIRQMKNMNISPFIYSQIIKCPGTSIDIERSFSRLKKLLQCDRNFKEGNVGKYMILLYNN